MSALSEPILHAAHERAQQAALPYFGVATPVEAHAALAALPLARLVDVRTRPEWEYVGRVPQSALVEWNTYPGGARNEDFIDELRRVAPALDAPVFFLCRSGARSDAAARAATAAGYTRAFNVLEGFEGDKDGAGQRGKLGGWRKHGLPWIQG